MVCLFENKSFNFHTKTLFSNIFLSFIFIESLKKIDADEEILVFLFIKKMQQLLIYKK